MNVGINFDREYNPDKSFDSQETISAEMTETETLEDMPITKSEKGKRRIVRTSSDSEDFINPSAMKNQHAQKMLKGTSKQSWIFCFYGIEITWKTSTSVQIHLGC